MIKCHSNNNDDDNDDNNNKGNDDLREFHKDLKEMYGILQDLPAIKRGN